MATALPRAQAAFVFVNCPFDSGYKPLFDAAVFAVHDLGFQARHALIHDGNARLGRIAEEIATARYSIHDLSRVELGGKLKMPRFNMPFEAGIAYAMHAYPRTVARPHHFLLLDAEPYRYQASLSDAGGLDPKIHGNEPKRVVASVREFLARASGKTGMPGGAKIWRRYGLFLNKLKPAARQQGVTLKELASWGYVNDLQALMASWIAENPPS
jgi:hypothetical protein